MLGVVRGRELPQADPQAARTPVDLLQSDPRACDDVVAETPCRGALTYSVAVSPPTRLDLGSLCPRQPVTTREQAQSSAPSRAGVHPGAKRGPL
jgi:hypothetical protein